MYPRILFLLLWATGCLLPTRARSQTAGRLATLSGIVRDRTSQEPLIGASVALEGTSLGTAADVAGRFRLSGIPPGTYTVRVQAVGYAPLQRFNVSLTTGNDVTLTLEPTAAAQSLNEVTVVANRAIRVASAETPLSVQRLTSEEILTNPGGNFDISRTVQSLPGVGGSTGGTGGDGFRNDIVIRGGAPNENVYYLDGIEVPVINHFATQGSAGGPVGILNVSFIDDVTLSSSAFEARYDNTLSSVLQFRQRTGADRRLQGNVRTSSSEAALTLEGPLGRKDSTGAARTTFLASVRRSYLQNLFVLLDSPIRPKYWDSQFKVTHRLSPKNTLTVLGIGALDNFSVVTPKETSPEKEVLLRATPAYEQWNYTLGASLRHQLAGGYWNLALSRTQLHSNVDLFEDRDLGNEARRVLLTRSGEAENKLRFDLNRTSGRWRWAAGASGQVIEFDSRFQQRVRREVRDAAGNVVSPGVTVRFANDLTFVRYGLFGQATRSFLEGDRLTVSAGVRTDGNTFTDTGNELWRTLSPRVSASYAAGARWNVNASVGRYFKIPTSTILGFTAEDGTPVNKPSRYIGSTHYVAGLEFIPTPATRFTLEGFFKQYDHYPVSVRDGISLANLGGDFSALGNEQVSSTGQGRAYGAEFFFQQKLTKKVYTVFSYTWFRSEFSGRDGVYRPSAWDTRHLLSALGGYRFGKGWQLGLKYRLAGGAPTTPYDLAASRATYLTTGAGVRDYTRLNSERLPLFQQLDFRLDKQFNFKRTALDVYVDVLNVLGINNPSAAQYTFERTADAKSFDTTDGQPVRLDGANARPVLLDDTTPLVVPTIGFIFQF